MAHPDHAPVLSHEHFCTILVHVARAYELPVAFFTNVIWQESKFDHRVVSRAGAQGVAQFMPKVAKMFGLENPFDAREALPASGRLLRTLLQKFGNLGLAAAAYNAGPSRVIAWQGKRGRLPKETIDYVQIVTGRPAESWDNATPQTAVFQVPPRVPCHQVELFAQVEQAERARMQVQAAEELHIAQQAGVPQIDVAVIPVAERARKTKLAEKPRQRRRIEASAARKRVAQVMRGRALKVTQLRAPSRKYSALPRPRHSRAARRS